MSEKASVIINFYTLTILTVEWSKCFSQGNKLLMVARARNKELTRAFNAASEAGEAGNSTLASK